MPKLLGYRVKILNSPENRVLVPFPDLCVNFRSGYVLPLQVREGDIIPIDALDPEDVRKSLIVGSLRRYLDFGKIEEVYEPELVVEIPVPLIVPSEAEVIPPTEKPIEPASSTPLVREDTASNQTPLTDLTLVKTYEDFCRMSYFLKLRFIKESGNTALLKEISTRTPSAQFKNNIQVRLA